MDFDLPIGLRFFKISFGASLASVIGQAQPGASW